MLHLVIGGAGCGKSAYLLQQLQKAMEQGQPIRTLVPEQFAFTYDKKLYAVLGAAGFNRCSTGSFRSLTTELLSSVAEAPRDPADEVAKTVVLHQILSHLQKENALRFYGGQAERPGFLLEMQKQLAELMQSGSNPALLAEAAMHADGVLSEKTLDIARIYMEYLNALEQRSLRDSMCDLAMAAAVANGSGYLKGTCLYLDEFESFTGDQYAMLEIMLQDAAEVWIALRTDNPDAPDYSRFDAVNQTCRKLRRMAEQLHIPCKLHPMSRPHRFAAPSLSHLSQYLFTTQLPAYENDAAVTVTEARDVTLEAEYTAAQIRQLLLQGKVKCRDIMVVTHNLERYGALLEAAFARYEIPYFMDLRRSVLHTAVMKLPLALLQLAHRTDTDSILLYLKTQLSPLHPAQAAMLENYAYTWDIEGEQWERNFAPETDPEGQLEALRNIVMEPILQLRRKGKDASGAVLCEALYQCMEDAGIPARVGGLAAHMNQQGDTIGGRALRRLWNRFTELLDAMHETLGEAPISFLQLSDLLTVVLRQNQIAVPPQTLDAVTVQSTAAARYDDPKIVFVLGIIEGEFPAKIQPGGLFTEQERNMLEQHGVTLARSVRDLCADERLIVYKTLSAASHHLYLSYPLAEENGSRTLPAVVLEQLNRLLPKRKKQYADRMGAAFYVSTKAAAYYSFVQDYMLEESEIAAVRTMLAQQPEDAQRLERLRRTADPARLRVTNPDLMHKLIGKEMRLSATQIENTIKCPFMGFCANGLRLYVRRKQNLNALSIGNLVHYCMERLFLEYPQRERFLALTEAELRHHAELCGDAFLQQELGGMQNRSQRFLENYRSMVARIPALLLHTQAEMAQSDFVPDACEMIIGTVGGTQGTAPFTLTLSNGMTVYLNGKIDRVDLCQRNGIRYLRVIDYKTGVKEYHLGDLYYGLNLQMLLYLFALLDGAPQYQDVLPAGVLYVPSGAPGIVRSRENLQSVADYFNSHFRMNGTVLCDRGVLTAMEQNVAGVYIPAALAKEDSGSGDPILTKDSQVFTQQQLSRLRKYVEEMVTTCAEQYAAGDVIPSPMERKSQGSFYANACAYCPYSGICGAGVTHTIAPRLPMSEKEAISAMQAIMNETQSDEKKEDVS